LRVLKQSLLIYSNLSMRNRIKSVKREHSTIQGLVPLLEKLTKLPAIKAIIPGRIKPIIGNYPEIKLEFKMKTPSGFKCLAKSGRAVQEVFIITNEVEKTLLMLNSILN
jgi:hypothetical protein